LKKQKNSEYSKLMKIRVHHLLCIQGFQGYGYSKNFINNMANVIQKIKENSDLKMKLITGCDIICSHCPYNKKGKCSKNKNSEKKLKKFEKDILMKIGVEENEKIKVSDFLNFFNEKLKNYSKEICNDCEWKEKCLWFIS